MIVISKNAICIAAGVAGALFLGYCIYFDKKRRNDPDYKKKVREHRRRNRRNRTMRIGLPDFSDHKEIERYFLNEIHLGENLIGSGEFEGGVEHLANAIVVCGQPERLMQVFQSSLTPPVFAILVYKLQDMAKHPPSPSMFRTNARSADNSSTVLGSSSSPVNIDELEY